MDGWQTPTMPMVTWLRRLARSRCGIRARVASLGLGLALAVAACTGGGDQPQPLVDATATVGGVDGPTASAPATSSQTDSTSTGTSALLDYPHLFAAMAVVPQKAAAVTFTDLDLVKQRLGYAGVTSESPTQERFDFWERARADGAVFTGTRLYDASSVMAIDYGWTGEDVAWEVDFTVVEEGCRRSMLCDRAHGFVLGLRPELDWSVVTGSLADNGFAVDANDPDTFTTDDRQAPFSLVHLIPELHAVAGGNPLGVQRLTEVVEGAPPFGPRIGPVYDRLGTVESLQVSTGCVDLAAALGPDSTSDDITEFLRGNVIGNLAPALSTTVSVAGRRTASIEVEAAAGATADDLDARQRAMRSWPGLQTGVPFADVADVRGALNGDYESFTLDVTDMPTFRAMVLTDDAPWALCPYTEVR